MKKYIRTSTVHLQDEPYEVLLEMAKSASLRPDKWDQLVHSEYYGVRAAVAANPNVPVDALDFLSKDQFYEVREAVAGNPNTPAEVLANFVADKSDHVRIEAIDNPNITEDILYGIASNCENLYVADHLLYLPNVPSVVLRALYISSAGRFSLNVRESVKRKLAGRGETI